MTAGEPGAASHESRSGRRKARPGKQAPADERVDPWEAALKLLAARARSQAEIRLHLGRRGYVPEEVAAVLSRLAAAGYVNDREFARDWVGARAARCGFGPARLTRELRAKGVAEEDIRAALGELLAERTPLSLAEGAARKKLVELQGTAPAVGRRRLAAYLSRRGFPTEVVLRLCRKYFPNLEESSELP